MAIGSRLRNAVRALAGRDLASELAALRRSVERLEEFSHGTRATYVGRNRVLVRAVVRGANIAYLVEADDLLISPWFIATGRYETAVTEFFLREVRPDTHCIDVGANFGYFTCLLARFCPQGRVVGVEADRHIFELTRDNIAINGFNGHARAVHAAVGDSTDPVTLYRRDLRSGNTSIIAMDRDFTEGLGEAEVTPFTVAGTTIDRLAESMDGRVDLIKIDVEGAEPRALAGARATIAANPQLRIVMEWSPGQIEAGGTPLPAFIASLAEMGLGAHVLDGAGQPSPIAPDALAALPYQAGVVLMRPARR